MSRLLLGSARRLVGLSGAASACSSSGSSGGLAALHHFSAAAAAAASRGATAAASASTNRGLACLRPCATADSGSMALRGLRAFASSSGSSSGSHAPSCLLLAAPRGGWAAAGAQCSALTSSGSSSSSSSSSLAGAAGAQQLQAVRGLLGLARTRPARPNYQDHNQTKPKRLKIKTRSVVKRRVIVAKDGTMWRTQAGRRHKRTKKSGGRLRELKGLAPLAAGWARKLRKLGYKRRWWYSEKA